MLTEFLNNLLDLILDTAVWLLFGLFLAALLKGWMPASLVERWLSGNGIGSVIRAAFIGAPLPLCSCGVLPTAIGLRRTGASKPATVSFLVATPETGVDSISVTYALLGPVMAIIRPIAAVTSAVFSGLLILFFDREASTVSSSDTKAPSCCNKPSPEPAQSCCSKQEPDPQTSCSSNSRTEQDCCSEKQPQVSGKDNLISGLRFAIVDILDDISGWLAFGLILAAIIATVVEPSGLSQWGSGLTAMLLMLVVGLPLYICATASTPLAAALLAAGMSPGAILVFLLVGPATNIASIGILSRELGIRAVVLYLTGISISAIILGLATDMILSHTTIAVGSVMEHHNPLFETLQWISAALLLVLAIKPLRRLIWRD